MGYACPVCDVPQADGPHLANHLAITALLHGDEHAAWLDAHVSDWRDRNPESLAPAVTDLAEPAEYHAVFEDTVAGHDGGRARHSRDVVPSPVAESDTLDPSARRIVERARRMTEARRDAAGDDVDAAGESEDR